MCPHLHEPLTYHLIAFFFSEPLIVSHFLSPLSICEVGFHSYCRGKREFGHLHWTLVSLNLLQTHTHTDTHTHTHMQEQFMYHTSLSLWSSPPLSNCVLTAVCGKIQEDTQQPEEEQGKHIFFFILSWTKPSTHIIYLKVHQSFLASPDLKNKKIQANSFKLDKSASQAHVSPSSFCLSFSLPFH